MTHPAYSQTPTSSTSSTSLLELEKFTFPRWEYPSYFFRLYQRWGIKALSKQFRRAHRRPFSRRLIQTYAGKGPGIEIGVGAFSIAPVKRTLLTDGFQEHASDASMAQWFCRADHIPCADQVFDFVLSEHTLEHLSNPIKALREWQRVLKPEGTLFLFLPHPHRTFDRHRARTPLKHLIEDEQRGTPDDDPSHLKEWEAQVLNKGLLPSVYGQIPLHDHPRLGILHHHVWLPVDLVELLTHLGWRILHLQDTCPDRTDSFVVVAQKPAD